MVLSSFEVEHCVQAKGDVQIGDGQSWLENAVTCYLQAIRHGSTEGRGMMARILNLLSFHDTNGVVSKAIRKHGRQVKPSLILNWLSRSVHWPPSPALALRVWSPHNHLACSELYAC